MNRTCGECTLCCKLLPVRELAKGAGERCRHQSRKGCGVYCRAGMPRSCRIWSCEWLLGTEHTEALHRPDRAHYVIDCMPDFITVRDEETGTATNVPVIQVWCNPKHPDAHRDPALRRYIEARGTAALIRYSNRDAMALMPPSMTHDHRWQEVKTNFKMEQQHTPAEVAEAIGGIVIHLGDK